MDILCFQIPSSAYGCDPCDDTKHVFPREVDSPPDELWNYELDGNVNWLDMSADGEYLLQAH